MKVLLKKEDCESHEQYTGSTGFIFFCLKLFYYSDCFCYYLWILLHFLTLFMSLAVLFQLIFTFIYNFVSNKFLISTK